MAQGAVADTAVPPAPATSRIAFVGGSTSSDIYVMNADGSGVRRITTHALDDFAPAWSPDGRLIAFARRRVHEAAADTGGADVHDIHAEPATDIYVINADGAGERRLTSGPGTSRRHAWSPNGRQIAFDAGPVDGRHAIYVVNVDGMAPRRLITNPDTGWAEDLEPAWSPDGRLLAFERTRVIGEDYRGDIYVMNADGSRLRRLTRLPGRSYEPRWSPDGNKIAFVHSPHGDREEDLIEYSPDFHVYVVNADGSGLKRLSRGLARALRPAWSPDGRMIAFEADIDAAHREIFVVSADGSGRRRLTRNTNSGGHSPGWSPDGKSIAFASERGHSADIYVMNADGSNVRRLTRDPRQESDPVWSP